MKKILFTLLALLSMGHASAQSGGISPEMLSEIRKACPATAETRALRNALAGTSINQLALAAENPALTDTYFSNEVPSKGVTDQKSSGRCWLFTGLNVFRARMIKKYELGKFEFSQSYCFFYDQLEKANLFLQATIDNAKKLMDEQIVRKFQLLLAGETTAKDAYDHICEAAFAAFGEENCITGKLG